ncbi:Patched domain-containing protein 3 [Armadillidium vulgare]|nr:Patched domain-containing protein 3 [Armadillidium vulgare]
MESQKCDILYKTSTVIINKLEGFFYWYGKTIAKRPKSFIIFCLVLTFLSGLGMINLVQENRPFKLWIPHNSDFVKALDWQSDHFPQKFRGNVVIYEAENVLKKEVILEMLNMHDSISNLATDEADWSTVCAKLPILKSNFFGRKKRSLRWNKKNNKSKLTRFKRQSWWFHMLSQNEYCDLLEKSQYECMEHSILEVWGYDRELINSLTEKRIITDINEATTSSVFGFPTNFTKYLGGIERDSAGNIISAKATKQVWVTQVNEEEIEKGNHIEDDGIGMVVDNIGFKWEKKFINTILNNSQNLSKDINIFLMTMSSFGMISDSTIQGDAQFLGVGCFIVFLYIQVMLGKFNLVEQRPVLSGLGLSCVGLAAGVSYGLCSAAGIPYGPVNNILPFLLLGLGVDDMFVFIQAWNNLNFREREQELCERVGLALKHAGVSITITSLTDFVAFAIGCTTVLPALRYFCLFAAVGIISIYFFQATFFVAWFTLDQRRLEDSRQGLFWCIKLKNWTPNKFSQKDHCQLFFQDIYSKFLLKTPVKIFVLIFTFSFLGVSAWGLSNLEQEFDPIWFLPHSSYLYKYFMKSDEYFPADGRSGVILFGNISLTDSIPKLNQLVIDLQDLKHISIVDSWFEEFKVYWDDYDYTSEQEVDKNLFSQRLGEFLYSPEGSKYRLRNFRFNGTFNCSGPAPEVLVSTFEYKHNALYGSKQKIGAMEDVKSVIRNLNFSEFAMPWARSYSNWETDKIIEIELYRNISMAMIVVGIMTLALIASVRTSLMVLLCVIMTLIDVGGLMHWWGLTIDTVSCIDLVLAVGLCVDYAAHIGHTFMIQIGSLNERVANTLGKIGPAVLNGGFSTFLAFVFLIRSDSHVFVTFFKIFFAVCLYGLYHGLVFLPVLLSLIGPPPYKTLERNVINTKERQYLNCLDAGATQKCLASEYIEDRLKDSAVRETVIM